MTSFQLLMVITAVMVPILATVDPEQMFKAVSEGKLDTVKSLLEQGGQTTWATPEGIKLVFVHVR